MRFVPILLAFILIFFEVSARQKDSVLHFTLPDSVKAVSFIADISIQSANARKETYAGISTSEVSLVLEADKKEKEVEFRFPSTAKVIATGINIDKENDELEWKYDWKLNTIYKLLIATAADSAGNFVLYSGYIFLPEHNKWKSIGTCRIDGQWSTIQLPAAIYSTGSKGIDASLNNVWVQRSNGTWKRLDGDAAGHLRPSISPMPNLDSIEQYNLEKLFLESAFASSPDDGYKNIEGLYYRIIEPGTGKQVSITDTVTVKYQLRLFNTTEIIDEATDKPATFPLNRLIKAWQLAIPLVKTGGKLKIVIPSGLAYSIRTRAPQIPPNSILEFDIEVLDTKPAISSNK